MIDSNFQLWENYDERWNAVTNYDWALNRAFKYGDGFFETIRVAYGIPQYWHLHLQRMNHAIATLGFVNITLRSWENLYQLLLNYISSLGLLAGRLRLSALRYAGGHYGPSADHWVVHIMLTGIENTAIEPVINSNRYQTLRPIRAITVSNSYLFPHPLGSFKTLNSLPYVLAQREAEQNGVETCLIFDQNGYLIEGSYANVVLIKQNQCYIPLLNNYGIQGIMQPIVVAVLESLGMPTFSQLIHFNSLHEFNHIWLTNTIIGIQEITQLRNMDNRNIDFYSNPSLTQAVINSINERLIQSL